MFCLLWRLVKSRNLKVSMSLPVFAVCTSISAWPFYTKIFEPLAAYAFGFVYLLCARTHGWSSCQSCLESPALGFAKGYQRALAITIVGHSLGELICQPGPVLCLVILPTGLNICELVWPYKGVFGGFIVGPPRAIQMTQLWRELWSWQLSILAFDIDLFFVTILLLLNRKQHWNPNGAPFQCWFLLTWLGWSQESRVDPETKVGSSTEQFSSTCLCLYWSWWAKPCCQWHSACVSILSCKCFTLRARCQAKVLIQVCSSVLSQFVLPLYLQELFAIF